MKLNASFRLASRSFKNTGPNNSTIFNRRIDRSIEASVLEVITSWKLQHILRSYKHEAFQTVKYKLDLIEQPYLDKIHSFLLFISLLLHFVSSFPLLIYKQLVRKEVFPVVVWNTANCPQSSKQWLQTELPKCSIEVCFGVLTLTPVVKNKWFLNKTWTFYSPNFLERLILLAIYSSKYREQTEAPLCLVPG